MTKSTINRRKFIKQTGMAGASLVIGYYLVGCQMDTPDPEGMIELYKPNFDDVPIGTEVNPFVIIDENSNITIMAHRPDMGQGTYQSMPLLVAEELNVPLEQVTIKQAPGDRKYGRQGVGGSASVRTMWEPMRKMGAAAREMLILAAAEKWQVQASDCYVENSAVINRKTKETLPYGELVAAASLLEIPGEPTLKDPAEFMLIGKSVPRPEVVLKSTGQAIFGLDIKHEGMVYAMIERSPNFKSKVKSFDDSEAMKIKGVQKVLKTVRPLEVHQLEGVAVIADNYWSALKGRKALKIEWEEIADLPGNEEIFLNMNELAANEDGVETHNEGNFDQVYNGAAIKLDATYELPFAAHAAMEPQNVVVDVREDSCEIWSPNQFPMSARGAAAEFLNIPIENVQVHVTFLGGGFGRRALADVVLEGCALSRELKKPVKVVWTREDDVQQSPFRPASVNRLQGGLDASGKLVALQHKVVAPSISYSLWNSENAKMGRSGEMEPVNEPFYSVPNFNTRYVLADVSPIPMVWWRSVYSSTNVFAHESFIDELAHNAGKDPMTFRRELLADSPRHLGVLNLLAEKSDWGKPLAEGKARGVAITNCFSTTAGHVVEVSRDGDNGIKIDRVITAIDCGIAVNPDNVKAQCEGCVVMGISAAIKPGITFQRAKAVESNFHNYPVLRINETPPIEVHIVDSNEAPTGVGEPALPPLAPALANAIFALTGKRIRKLPMDLANI